MFVLGILLSHILILVAFEVDFLFHILLLAALGNPPFLNIKDPLQDRSNVSLSISLGCISGYFGIHSSIYFMICTFGSTFQPHRGSPVPNYS